MDGSDRKHGAPGEDNLDLAALVETPMWGDAKFFGRWLLAAIEAQQALEVALESDPSLRRRGPLAQLGIDAMLCIYHLVPSYCSFIIDIAGEYADGFCILAQRPSGLRRRSAAEPASQKSRSTNSPSTV
jgi:hypothetical protein